MSFENSVDLQEVKNATGNKRMDRSNGVVNTVKRKIDDIQAYDRWLIAGQKAGKVFSPHCQTTKPEFVPKSLSNTAFLRGCKLTDIGKPTR